MPLPLPAVLNDQRQTVFFKGDSCQVWWQTGQTFLTIQSEQCECQQTYTIGSPSQPQQGPNILYLHPEARNVILQTKPALVENPAKATTDQFTILAHKLPQ